MFKDAQDRRACVSRNEPDPFDVELRVHGTGHNEFNLLPAVRGLRKAILGQYDDSGRRVHEPAGLSLASTTDLDDDEYGPATGLLLMTTQSFGTLEDEFIIAYGVNHHATGKAAYMNINIYGLTAHADDVDDLQLAAQPPFLGADYPDVGNCMPTSSLGIAPMASVLLEVRSAAAAIRTHHAVWDDRLCGPAADEQGVVVWRVFDPVQDGPDRWSSSTGRLFSPQP